MLATLTACALAATTSMSPQGLPGRPSGPVGLRIVAPHYPGDPEMAGFAPYVDQQGKPRRTEVAATGAADLDGDGNTDLWFLAGPGPDQGRLSLQLARSSDLGRYRLLELVQAGPWLDAATYHSKTSSVDKILAVGVTQDQPMLLHWNPQSSADPRIGYLGGALSGWVTGLWTYEIKTGDIPGDGHDDIMVLQALPGGGTAVQLLELGTKEKGYLAVERHSKLELPVPLRHLQMLDLDGDKRTDFVVVVPGLGVLACWNDGTGHFQPAGYWPVQQGLNDLTVGDMDGNGRDDIACTFDAGVFLACSFPVSSTYPTGFGYSVYQNPTGVGALHTARIMDGDGKGSMLLLAFPRDGRNYVVHPQNPAYYGLIGPWVEPAPDSLTGPGVLGESVLVTDVDSDGDPDLLMQAPSGAEWLHLRNEHVSFAPLRLTVTDQGPAPIGEGTNVRRQDITVDLPKALIDAGIMFVEMGFYVADPDSKNPKDPDYIYWGRVLPGIDPIRQQCSITVYFDQDVLSWQARVREFIKRRVYGGGKTLVYPEKEWETIRGGPDAFFSIHGLDNGKRFQSKQGASPPGTGKSTVGAGWVLRASPPSPKADDELLPWE